MANVSYAGSDSLLEALVLHTLPDFGPMGDGIINNNLLLAYLKQKDRMEIIEGGLEFWNGVITGQNTNMKWQGHEDVMTANLQDPAARLRYDIKTFAGAAIVINKKHEAMNKGRAMIKQWAKTLREQADSTIKNLFNSAFWNTAPGANEPESLATLISATPTTGTIGGQTRSASTAYQNIAYTTAVADIGSEAGLAALKRQIIRAAITGNDFPDLCITDDNLYAGLCGYLETLRRFKSNDKMGELGFDTVMMGKTTIGFENTNVTNDANTITAGYVYGVNSNWMKLKVLKDGNFKFGDGFERIGQTLNRALYFWVFCNLCATLPKSHFVMTSVSTT